MSNRQARKARRAAKVQPPVSRTFTHSPQDGQLIVGRVVFENPADPMLTLGDSEFARAAAELVPPIEQQANTPTAGRAFAEVQALLVR